MFVELGKHLSLLFKFTFVISCFISKYRGNHSDLTRYKNIIREEKLGRVYFTISLQGFII